MAAVQAASPTQPQRRIGRYEIFSEIASGGMATVYFGRLIGVVGFSRSVAIKQLHAQYARSPEFVAQFLDEARLTARIRHPNVVSVLDVVTRDGELFVIMDYVQGEPLSRLARMAGAPLQVPIASAIMTQVLSGMHAAHEATGDNGTPLEIIHRDVSPQNILVGVDGTSHLLDFGIAKAASRIHTTENGQIKGKLAYMAPEQLRSAPVDRRVDVFAAGIVLWEMLTGQRLFFRQDAGGTIAAVLMGTVTAPSEHCRGVSPELDAVVLKALQPNPSDRFASARDMALALEQAAQPASNLRVGGWVESVAKDSLAHRASLLRQAEETSSVNQMLDPRELQLRLANSPAGSPSESRLLTAGAVAIATPAGPVALPAVAKLEAATNLLGTIGEPSAVAVSELDDSLVPTARPPAPTTVLAPPRAQQTLPDDPANRYNASVSFRNRGRLGILLAAALSLGLLVAFLAFRAEPSSPLATSADGANAVLRTAPTVAQPEPSSASDPPRSKTMRPLTPTDLPLEPPPSEHTAALASRAPTPTARPIARQPANPERIAPNCTPPYVLDEAGRKRFKKECF